MTNKTTAKKMLYLAISAILLLTAVLVAAAGPAAAEELEIDTIENIVTDGISLTETEDLVFSTLESVEPVMLMQTAAVKSAAATPYVTRDVVLLLDVSGSMSSSRMTAMKAAVKKYISCISKEPGNNRVALVTYSSTCTTKQSLTSNWSSFDSIINGLPTSGNGLTYTRDALAAADTILSQSSAAYREIVLFSDGLPEGGASSNTGKYVYEDESYHYSYANVAYSLATELKPKYTIKTVGLFNGLSGVNRGGSLYFARMFMQDIQNAGYYEVSTTNVDDLIFVFEDLLNPPFDVLIENAYGTWDSVSGKSVQVSTPVKFIMNADEDEMLGLNARIIFTTPDGSTTSTFGGVTYNGIPITAKGELVLGTSYPSSTDLGEFSALLELYDPKDNTSKGWSRTVTITFTMKVIQNVYVTYNANGATSGTVPVDNTAYPLGSTVTIRGNTGSLSLDGYKFAGWNTLPGGYGVRPTYKEGDTLTIATDTTFYAVWLPAQAKTVTVMTNGCTARFDQPVTIPVLISGAEEVDSFTFTLPDIPGVQITVNEAQTNAALPSGGTLIVNGSILTWYNPTNSINGDDQPLFYIDVLAGIDADIPIEIALPETRTLEIAEHAQDATDLYTLIPGYLNILTIIPQPQSEWNALTNITLGYDVHPHYISNVTVPAFSNGKKAITLDETGIPGVTNPLVQKWTPTASAVEVPAAIENGKITLTGSISDATSVNVWFTGRKLGDVNADNTVTTLDALQIAKDFVQPTTLTDTDRFYGDVNKDGSTSTADALQIAKYVVHLLDEEYKLI